MTTVLLHIRFPYEVLLDAEIFRDRAEAAEEVLLEAELEARRHGRVEHVGGRIFLQVVLFVCDGSGAAGEEALLDIGVV